MKRIFTTIIAASCLLFYTAKGQICGEIASFCSEHLGNQFISDGQVYRALLNDEDIAEFETTLFSGSTYRIAAVSGMEDGNLIMEMYDTDNNLLYSNKDHGNAPYWDFTVESTIVVRIEAKLDVDRVTSGCAVLLIGFKQQ